MFEIVEDHRALADPDRMRQPAARRFVAHVRTVGKIVRTELAHEDRIEERRLVRGAAGGVELGLVRARKRAEMPADPRDSVDRSAERCVGTGCARTCGYEWLDALFKTKRKKK